MGPCISEEFRENKEKYLTALLKIAAKHTSSAISTSGEQVSYDLVPIERRFDAFGSWEVDKLFGHMKVHLLHPSPNDPKKLQPFPLLWRTTEVSPFSKQTS